MLESTNSMAMRIEHPELAFELETSELEYQFTNLLFLEGYLKTWEKNAHFVIQLNAGYELVISPMVRSYGGYPVWGRAFKFFSEQENKEITQTMYHFHCALRSAVLEEAEFQFEIESRSLGRAIEKALNHIKNAHHKRFVALPVVTINK
jgi:hypothetical protein